MKDLIKEKREVLLNLDNIDSYNQYKEEEKKKDRCNLIDQLIATRYKTFTKKDLLKYCLNHNEPTITSLFDRLY